MDLHVTPRQGMASACDGRRAGGASLLVQHVTRSQGMPPANPGGRANCAAASFSRSPAFPDPASGDGRSGVEVGVT